MKREMVMRYGTGRLSCLFLLVFVALDSAAVDLVVDGRARATIVVLADAAQPAAVKGKGGRQQRNDQTPGDAMAARVLVDWVKKITGVELPIADSAAEGATAIYVGQAAIKAGLTLDDIESSTNEGLRIVADDRRVLLAGQDGQSTVKAACRLLEEFGCRYLMDGPLGEVYPSATSLSVKKLDLREKPGMAVRQIWGSSWSGNSLWKIWNGAGGLQMNQGHAWGGYVSHDLFDTHPEYFALRGGERKKGDWYCTSNPELRKVFAAGVLRKLEETGGVGASLSPPDGTGYCECDKCRAEDDPESIEPSSGRVCVTNRYVDFFNDVAKRVAERFPKARLNFYCYADYTQAPTRGLKLEPNLVAWVAPLRYCRLHAIGHENCPSRVQLQGMIDGWGKAASAIGYRTYNFNLAECVVPFSMLSIWRHDVPYLKAHNAIGVNLESLASWQIYGPHMYLSLRLAYDPSADADALLADYFAKFYGPAGGAMRDYWMGIDRAFAELPVHAGSFYAIHRVYTNDFLVKCRDRLDRALAAVKGAGPYRARVAMHYEGFENAHQYAALRDFLNVGMTKEALGVYQQLLARTEEQTKAGYGNHYTPDYVRRFLGKIVEPAATATAGPNRVAQVLPDQWKLAYDEKDAGAAAGYAKADFDAANWKTVATYSDTLEAQGLADRKTIMWYRMQIELAPFAGKRALFFVEVDGLATVYINGQEAGTSPKKRLPLEVDAAALRPGVNTVAVRVDHTGITELFLGGIIRPVYLIEKPAP